MSNVKIVMDKVPMYWMHETIGVLKKAVLAFLDHKETPEDMELVIKYCKAWVDCPIWTGNVEGLRKDINKVKTAHQLRGWIYKALDEGIDPL